MIRAAWLVGAAVIAAIATGATARAADLQPRVLVLPAEGKPPAGMPKLGTELGDALARGAARTTPNVQRSEATLSDTAVIVGCDPSARTCLDAVAAALNVDQVVFARISPSGPTGDDATIDVTAITRETEPLTRRFTVHAASKPADLAAIEPAVVEMLDSGEARRSQVHHDAAQTQPTPLPPPPPTTVTTTPEGEHPAWPILVTGGGAALAITGASLWAIASSKQKDIDHAPTSTVDDLNNLASLESSAKRYATAGNVLVIGGAIVTVAGGALWWRAWHAHGDTVTVAPAVGPDHAGVIIGGSW